MIRNEGLCFGSAGCEVREEERVFDLLSRLTKTLGELLGPMSEIVLHDLRQADNSIVAIANAQMTGRKVGDTIEALGLHLFEGNHFEDMANYETRTESGRTLRSCSVFVKDRQGKPIGALCVNQDLSALLSLRNWIDAALHRDVTPGAEAVESRCAENQVESVLKDMIDEAIRSTGKMPEQFTREDKLRVISYLDARGAFLIRYSMEQVAALLGISKFSIYNYLGNLREEA
jgi:predicted transcriptional regulator YheO